MKQAEKGNGWHFGMKTRIGADAGTGTAHGAGYTAANVADRGEARKPVRADDDFVNGDAGIEKREEITGDERQSDIERRINGRKGKDRRRDAELYRGATGHPDRISLPRRDERIE